MGACTTDTSSSSSPAVSSKPHPLQIALTLTPKHASARFIPVARENAGPPAKAHTEAIDERSSRSTADAGRRGRLSYVVPCCLPLCALRQPRTLAEASCSSIAQNGMKVCIIGASGKLGQYMVEHALTRGYDVIGVCREQSVEKLARFADRIIIVPGATNDSDVIRRAVAGCDGVLVVLAPRGVGAHYASGTAQAVLDHAEP